MVYCSKCGTKNEEDAKECVNCGASLEAGAGWEKDSKNAWKKSVSAYLEAAQ